MLQQLDTTGKNLGTSLYDRKDLLLQRLEHKFGTEKESYIQILQQLHLI